MVPDYESNINLNMKKLSILLIFLSSFITIFAQNQYSIDPEFLCWNINGVDSSIVRYSLISSRRGTKSDLGFFNASGDTITVAGGTLSFQNGCCCGSSTGGSAVADQDSISQLFFIGNTLNIVNEAGDTLTTTYNAGAAPGSDSLDYRDCLQVVEQNNTYEVQDQLIYDTANVFRLKTANDIRTDGVVLWSTDTSYAVAVCGHFNLVEDVEFFAPDDATRWRLNADTSFYSGVGNSVSLNPDSLFLYWKVGDNIYFNSFISVSNNPDKQLGTHDQTITDSLRWIDQLAGRILEIRSLFRESGNNDAHPIQFRVPGTIDINDTELEAFADTILNQGRIASKGNLELTVDTDNDQGDGSKSGAKVTFSQDAKYGADDFINWYARWYHQWRGFDELTPIAAKYLVGVGNNGIIGPVSFVQDSTSNLDFIGSLANEMCVDTVFESSSGLSVSDAVKYVSDSNYDAVGANELHDGFVLEVFGDSAYTVMFCGVENINRLTATNRAAWTAIQDSSYYSTNSGIAATPDSIQRPLFTKKGNTIRDPILAFGNNAFGSASLTDTWLGSRLQTGNVTIDGQGNFLNIDNLRNLFLGDIGGSLLENYIQIANDPLEANGIQIQVSGLNGTLELGSSGTTIINQNALPNSVPSVSGNPNGRYLWSVNQSGSLVNSTGWVNLDSLRWLGARLNEGDVIIDSSNKLEINNTVDSIKYEMGNLFGISTLKGFLFTSSYVDPQNYNGIYLRTQSNTAKALSMGQTVGGILYGFESVRQNASVVSLDSFPINAPRTIIDMVNIRPQLAADVTASATEGDIVFVNSTNATFTSIGSWIYENGNWKKLTSEDGEFSGNVDGSGDVTVSHALSGNYTVQITQTGTTPYDYTVHTKSNGTFLVRFYSTTTAAVLGAATPVAFDYRVKSIQ